MDKFKVVFTGTLKPGVDQEEFIDTFSSRFKVSKEKALLMLTAGKPVTIKKDLDGEQAAKYVKALDAMGMVVRQKPMPTEGLSLVPMEEEKAESASGTPTGSTNPSGETCPKCGSSRIDNDNCLGCGIVISKYLQWAEEHPEQAEASSPAPAGASNPEYPATTATAPSAATGTPAAGGEQNPYQAPEAELTQPAEYGEMTGPVSVPAGNGWTWIKNGFSHFRRNPGSWILSFIILIVLNIVFSLVPMIGSWITTLLSPVFAAGFMIGCRAQEDGDDFTVGHLFEGFKQNTGQLILVGLLYLIGVIIVTVLAVMAVIGSAGLGVFFGGDPAAMAANPDFSGSIILAVLIMFLFLVPFIMAYWFAPALVALEGLSALNAMKMSFSGCLKNILPFLLYGIIAMVLFILATIPIGLGLLVVVPMLTASIYTGYRDIYFS
jgi:uncharacterized membrane protein